MSARLDAIAAYDRLFAGVEKREEKDALDRDLACEDLFFLLVYVLGRKDINADWITPAPGLPRIKRNPDWLFDRCREIEAAPNGYLDLWAREHYKSTLITFGLTIRDILRDPEITVGIFSYSRPIAKAFLRQIKLEFEGNIRLKELFPDILWEEPHRDAPKWSEDDGITVRRKGNPKEATIEAWGLVEAQPTSKHYRLMVYDDVVTEGSVTNPDMIAKVTRSWEVSLNLTAQGGAVRYIGTRWHYADTYRDILERGTAIERRHAITLDGTANGEPAFWTREQVAKKRQDLGRAVFAAQMLLDPAAEGARDFEEEWLRYYEESGSYGEMNKYVLVDPASSKKKQSDYTAMAVIGLGSDNNYYLLDAIRDRLSLTERGDALFALHRRWRPLYVGYESYGMQADVEYFYEKMREDNYRFEITKLGGTLAKVDRIRRMVPVFEAGRFWLPDHLEKMDYNGHMIDLTRAFVDQEYKAFPVALHDDLFDTISRIEDPEITLVWPLPAQEEDRYARKRDRRRRATWMAA